MPLKLFAYMNKIDLSIPAILLMPSSCMANQKQYGRNFPQFRSSLDDEWGAELKKIATPFFMTSHARGDTQFESGKWEIDIVPFKVDWKFWCELIFPF